MKILVVSQYFWPEDFRINDICKGLKEKGHEVEILTGLPNYPKGEFFEGYSLLNKGPKEYEGMRIHRVMMSPRGKSSVGLAFNYLTFMIMGMLKSLFLLRNKYDAIFVFQVSPITSATSYTRWCRPRGPVEPMYMPGRLRTASRPSRT